MSPRTLSLEHTVVDTGGQASWEDADGNGAIDSGETVCWAWNSGGPANSLIPLYARGAGATLFAGYATGIDPGRGAYAHNTDVWRAMDAVTTSPMPVSITRSGDDLVLSWTGDPSHLSYSVYRATDPYMWPATGAAITATSETSYVDRDCGQCRCPRGRAPQLHLHRRGS